MLLIKIPWYTAYLLVKQPLGPAEKKTFGIISKRTFVVDSDISVFQEDQFA